MDLEIGGKIVIVTGGAKGIGEATVRALVAEGAVPVIVDRDGAAGERVVDEMTARGARCELVVRDLAEPGECQAAMDDVVQATGRLDALVNNAGLNDGVGIEDGTAEAFMTSLRRSLVHYFEMTHFALPFLKQSRGAIVNVSSKVALTGQGGTSGYAAAKGGILALTREWAVDLSQYGVRVNAVVPAEVITPAYQAWLGNFPNGADKLARIVDKIPLGKRMTTPEEIAASVLFLLSPQAGHTTGQQLVVDGGYVHLDRSMT
jgi:L-fucose dehydrogenase